MPHTFTGRRILDTASRLFSGHLLIINITASVLTSSAICSQSEALMVGIVADAGVADDGSHAAAITVQSATFLGHRRVTGSRLVNLGKDTLTGGTHRRWDGSSLA